jgi:hypothetical protein
MVFERVLPGKRLCGIAIGSLLTIGLAAAATVTLTPTKDNTLYEIEDGSISNGKGQHFFTGMTIEPLRKRGLMAFDLSSIPAGSSIVSATLRLNMSKTIALPEPTSLHHVLADWGEAGSDAPGPEGTGALAQAGDATWLHRFFPSTFWTTAGGDFSPTPSATTTVGLEDLYFWSSPGMVADLQGWLDTPATNFGWLVFTYEGDFPSAKRFDTRENSLPANRPQLTIRYSPPGSAGSVPDGSSGPPLTVQNAGGGLISLAWGASCTASDFDFAIYEGALGSFPSHHPVVCTTSGATTKTFIPGSGNRYYLVVPRNAGHEGSYGRNSSGSERPTGTPECLPQLLAECP